MAAFAEKLATGTKESPGRAGASSFWTRSRDHRGTLSIAQLGPSAGVAAIAIAHAVPARGARLWMIWRGTGGAGCASPTAFLLHAMLGRKAGGARLAGGRAMVLHLLPGCAVRHALARALGMSERARGDQETRCRGDRERLHGGGSFASLRFRYRPRS
jgi:hypothetical protein